VVRKWFCVLRTNRQQPVQIIMYYLDHLFVKELDQETANTPFRSSSLTTQTAAAGLTV